MESATSRGVQPGAATERVPVFRRLSTETKSALKTTEFWAMLGVIAAILVSAAAIDGEGDTFIAKQAWLYVAIVASAYMISRGLAKSGSREPIEPDLDDRRR